MECIELIVIRTMDAGRVKELTAVLEEIKHSEADIQMKLYIRSDLQSDICIFLYQDCQDLFPKKSRLGLTIAELLTDFGYISHSVWMENEI